MSSLLGDATKKNTVLNKAVAPKKYTKNYKRGSKQDYRDRDRERSRSSSPRRDRSRDRSGGSGSKYNNRKRKSSRDNDKSSKKAKTGSGSNKKKGIIANFDTWTWSSFLTSSAIMMVTALGLVTQYLPTMETFPLGGRIQYYIDNWRKICSNQWVLNTVEFGYKIVEIDFLL